jgi:hypothetical protein
MTTYLSNAISNATSLEAVAALVSAGTNEGLDVVGGTEFTPSMLAGQYAWQGAKEAGDGEEITEQHLEGQLECLHEAGAKFDEQAAIAHGMKIANTGKE